MRELRNYTHTAEDVRLISTFECTFKQLSINFSIMYDSLKVGNTNSWNKAVSSYKTK